MGFGPISGGGGGGFGFELGPETNQFSASTRAVAEAVRDAYFADPANATQLAEYNTNNVNNNRPLHIEIQFTDTNGNGVAQRQARNQAQTGWVDRGDSFGVRGAPGADGDALKFSSEQDRQAFFTDTTKLQLLRPNANCDTTEADGSVSTYRWLGIENPPTYDDSLWYLASRRTGPNSSIIGASALHQANNVMTVTNIANDLHIMAMNRITEADGLPQLRSWVFPNAAATQILCATGGTNLTGPFNLAFPANLPGGTNSFTISYSVYPTTTGTLRNQGWLGTDDSGGREALITDELITITQQDVDDAANGTPKTIRIEGGTLTLSTQAIFVRMSGVQLDGGLQTSGIFQGQTQPRFESNVFSNGELRSIMMDGDVDHPVTLRRDMPSEEDATALVNASLNDNSGLWVVANDQLSSGGPSDPPYNGHSNRSDAQIRAQRSGFLDLDGNEIPTTPVAANTLQLRTGTIVRVFGANDYRVVNSPVVEGDIPTPLPPVEISAQEFTITTSNYEDYLDRTIRLTNSNAGVIQVIRFDTIAAFLALSPTRDVRFTFLVDRPQNNPALLADWIPGSSNTIGGSGTQRRQTGQTITIELPTSDTNWLVTSSSQTDESLLSFLDTVLIAERTDIAQNRNDIQEIQAELQHAALNLSDAVIQVLENEVTVDEEDTPTVVATDFNKQLAGVSNTTQTVFYEPSENAGSGGLKNSRPLSELSGDQANRKLLYLPPDVTYNNQNSYVTAFDGTTGRDLISYINGQFFANVLVPAVPAGTSTNTVYPAPSNKVSGAGIWQTVPTLTFINGVPVTEADELFFTRNLPTTATTLTINYRGHADGNLFGVGTATLAGVGGAVETATSFTLNDGSETANVEVRYYPNRNGQREIRVSVTERVNTGLPTINDIQVILSFTESRTIPATLETTRQVAIESVHDGWQVFAFRPAASGNLAIVGDTTEIDTGYTFDTLFNSSFTGHLSVAEETARFLNFEDFTPIHSTIETLENHATLPQFGLFTTNYTHETTTQLATQLTVLDSKGGTQNVLSLVQDVEGQTVKANIVSDGSGGYTLQFEVLP